MVQGAPIKLLGGIRISEMNEAFSLDSSFIIPVVKLDDQKKNLYSSFNTLRSEIFNFSAQGDLATFKDNELFILPVGTQNQVLQVNNGNPSWMTLPNYLVNNFTANGQLITQVEGSPAVINPGSNGDFLKIVNGLPAWVNQPLYQDPLISSGQILYRNSSTSLGLNIGSQGQFLVVDNGLPAWRTISLYNDPLTTKGDVLFRGEDSTQRLPLGSTNQVLSVASTGIPEWKTLNLYSSPLLSNGSLLSVNGGNEVEIPIGTNGQVLTVVGGFPTWQTLNLNALLVDPTISHGDIIANAFGTPSRISPGSNGQVLTISGGFPTWQSFNFPEYTVSGVSPILVDATDNNFEVSHATALGGTFGSNTQTPIITTDSFGHITAITLENIAPQTLTVNNGSAPDITINLATQKLSLVGTSPIQTSVSGQTATINILSSNITSNNGITTTGGLSGRLLGASDNLNFALTGQALNFHNFTGEGLIVRNGSGTLFGRAIEVTSPIVISNGNGIGGNPSISHAATSIGTGSVGSSSSIPVIGYNNFGHITSVGSASITTSTLGAVPTSRTITINGTANRITSSAGAQPLDSDRTWNLDIASTYVGQTSITTLGTITTGTVPAPRVSAGTFGNGSYIINQGEFTIQGTGPRNIYLTTSSDNTLSILLVNSVRNWSITNSIETGNFRITDNTATADRIIIDTSGRVGINTTPTEALHVSGKVRISNYTTIAGTAIGRDGNGVIGDLTVGNITAGAGITVNNGTGRVIGGTNVEIINNFSVSGANNYVAKFTPNGSTLGSSTIYEILAATNRINVGINTTTFDTASNDRTVFHINGSSSSLLGLSTSNTTRGWLFATDSTIDLNSQTQLNFNTSGNIRMTILNNGNVGIGTTSPNTLLQVGNNTGVISTTTLHLADSYLEQTGQFGFRIAGIDNGVNGHDLLFYGRTASTGAFNPVAIIKNTGNVGIGTTSPARRLHLFTGSSGATPDTSLTQQIIESSGDSGIHIINPNSNIGRILFGTPSNQYGGLIRWDNTENNLALATDKANGYIRFFTSNFIERLRITSSGNVGIDDTSPNHKLSIKSNPASFDQLSLEAVTTTPGKWSLGQGISGIDGLVIRNAGVANRLVILRSNGNIGIGTDSPNRPLHIARNTGSVYLVVERLETSTTSAILIGAESNRTAIYSRLNDTSSTARDLAFVMGSTEQMRLSTTGQLDVKGDIVGVSAAISDARAKNIHGRISNPFDIINRLNGYNITWKETNKVDYAIVAQEVQEVYPHAVSLKSGFKRHGLDEYLTVNHSAFVPLFVEGLKEHDIEINKLKEEVKQLRYELSRLSR
jgi:hypothetical protein